MPMTRLWFALVIVVVLGVLASNASAFCVSCIKPDPSGCDSGGEVGHVKAYASSWWRCDAYFWFTPNGVLHVKYQWDWIAFR